MRPAPGELWQTPDGVAARIVEVGDDGVCLYVRADEIGYTTAEPTLYLHEDNGWVFLRPPRTPLAD